jgi:hypothetical protein
MVGLEFANDEEQQAGGGNDHQRDDEVRTEPVFLLSFIEQDLE